MRSEYCGHLLSIDLFRVLIVLLVCGFETVYCFKMLDEIPGLEGPQEKNETEWGERIDECKLTMSELRITCV